MNPESQRIALAEYSGWVFEKKPGCDLNYMRLVDPTGKCRIEGYNPFRFIKKLPDYLNDLNAMHELVMRLPNDGVRDDFNAKLSEITCADFDHSELYSFDAAVNATAAHRAEALLKTLDLWIERESERPSGDGEECLKKLALVTEENRRLKEAMENGSCAKCAINGWSTVGRGPCPKYPKCEESFLPSNDHE